MRRTVEVLGILLGLISVGIFAQLMLEYRSTSVWEVDNRGYVLLAQSLSRLELPAWNNDPFLYNGHPFVSCGEGKATVKYSLGWPLLLAVGQITGGPEGMMWVNTVTGVLGALFFFLLALELFGGSAAFVLSVIWLSSPHLLGYVVYPLTHSSDVCAILASFYFAFLWARKGRRRHALGLGLMAGLAMMIRPANILMWPAMFLAVPCYRRWGPVPQQGLLPPFWKSFVLALSLPCLFTALYNMVQFGTPWTTGYRLSHEQFAFDFSLIPSRWPGLLSMRSYLLDDRVWWAAIAGALWCFKRKSWLLLVFALWALPLSYAYFGYYWYTPRFGTAYTRFFLGALPAVVLCIGAILGDLRRVPRLGPLLSLALMIAALIWVWKDPPSRSVALCRGLNSRTRNESLCTIASYLPRTPTALYSYDGLAYHATLYSQVLSYRLNDWQDRHFFSPPGKACDNLSPREQPERHARMHEIYKELGPKGLQARLLAQVKSELENKLTVLFAPRDAKDLFLSLCDSDPDLEAKEITRPGSPQRVFQVLQLPK
ncbi:MAG: glycosyltransferase family 39 protein [Planctomycetes bacterium]|nr:glycosyltransferase family 39 protein [Planctomycetota bacterium]